LAYNGQSASRPVYQYLDPKVDAAAAAYLFVGAPTKEAHEYHLDAAKTGFGGAEAGKHPSHHAIVRHGPHPVFTPWLSTASSIPSPVGTMRRLERHH